MDGTAFPIRRFDDQDPIEEAAMYIGIGGLILLVIILIILF